MSEVDNQNNEDVFFFIKKILKAKTYLEIIINKIYMRKHRQI